MNARRQPKYIFYINDPNQFDAVSPSFDKPTEIGYFSLDIKTDFEISKKSLRYLIRPENPERVTFDLRKGYDTMIKRSEREKETHLFKWIMENREKISNQEDATSPTEGASGSDKPVKCTPPKDPINVDQEPACLQTGLDKLNISTKEDPESPIATQRNNRQLNTDFVCWRGLLTKFLCTPYEKRDDWLVAVTLYNGTYYLCEFETEKKKRENASMTKRDDEMCCWGWKFEQYMTADTPDGVPDTESPYNNCEAFCTFVRSRLNSHSLVYAGEVDAEYTDNVYGKHYVELKTSREITHHRQHVNFKRFKLIKWWAQSFLVDIPEIICGYRDDDGIVHKLKSFSTMQLPEIVKDIHDPWKANVCFNFLDQLLSFIKASVKVDDHRIVHLLEWSPGGPVKCSNPLRDSEYNFLPDWYTN